jgi:cystathionine beta-lyase/cystathionine gamma-synthase
MMSRFASFTTRSVHAGRGPAGPSVSRPLTPPIYQNTVFAYERLEDLDTLNPDKPSFSYYRYGTPTHAALEGALCELEGGEEAVLASSGMAILTAIVFTLAGMGDTIVADRHMYGGTYTFLTQDLPRLGIQTELVDGTDLDEVSYALRRGAKGFFVETLSNPTLRVNDLPALCELGQQYEVPVIVDATFSSPALIRPLEHGAAISWHSIAKYLGGHSAAAGGVATGQHTLIAAIRQKIAQLGSCQSSMDAWLTMLGLPTLPLRMAAHSRTARAIAEYLTEHPAVEAVYFPGLPAHPEYELASRLYPDGSGGMLSFNLHGGMEAAQRLIERIKLITFAPSLGDVTTTLAYPYATSHFGLPDEVLQTLGISKGMVRLSAGIEDPADVIADLEQALS